MKWYNAHEFNRAGKDATKCVFHHSNLTVTSVRHSFFVTNSRYDLHSAINVKG